MDEQGRRVRRRDLAVANQAPNEGLSATARSTRDLLSGISIIERARARSRSLAHTRVFFRLWGD